MTPCLTEMIFIYKRDVIHSKPALAHHLFQVAIGELLTAVPTDAQKYNGGLEVTPLEW
jgi:hypothetical protein